MLSPYQREGLSNLHTEFMRVFRRLEAAEGREAALAGRVSRLEADLSLALVARDTAEAELQRQVRVQDHDPQGLQQEADRLREHCDVVAAREQAVLETLDGVRRQLAAVQQELQSARSLADIEARAYYEHCHYK